jgi:phosphate starvation-inducible PhoH-like protein
LTSSKTFPTVNASLSRYNTIDNNVIERVILGDVQDDKRNLVNDKILVHGVGGKINKAMTLTNNYWLMQ